MGIKLLLAVLAEAEDRIEAAPSHEEEHRWIVFHSFMVATYVVSLRGLEGFLLDLDGLTRHKSQDGSHYWGRSKEHQDWSHLVPCIPIASSGIDIHQSVNRLMDIKVKLGFVKGPDISGRDGQILSVQCIH